MAPFVAPFAGYGYPLNNTTPTLENSNMVLAPTEAQIQAELREILGHPNRDAEVREVHKVLNAQPNQAAGLTAERIRELVYEWFPGNNPEELFRAVMHSIDLAYDLPTETPAQLNAMSPQERLARAEAWRRIGEKLVSESDAMRRDMNERAPTWKITQIARSLRLEKSCGVRLLAEHPGSNRPTPSAPACASGYMANGALVAIASSRSRSCTVAKPGRASAPACTSRLRSNGTLVAIEGRRRNGNKCSQVTGALVAISRAGESSGSGCGSAQTKNEAACTRPRS